MKKTIDTTLINEQIRAEKVQVISHTGENLGTMSSFKALQLAREVELDLVQLSVKDDVPLVKIMDFGKNVYEKKKKVAESKKKAKVIKIKEIKFRPKIGEHDYQTKVNQGAKFLTEGNKLKVTLMFRGREIQTSEERGNELFDRITVSLLAAGVEEVAHEKDVRGGSFWTRIYFVKK